MTRQPITPPLNVADVRLSGAFRRSAFADGRLQIIPEAQIVAELENHGWCAAKHADDKPAGQARRMSAIEAVCSTAIGFGVSYLTSYLVLPMFGFPVTASQNLGITCIFTVISLVRGYFVRRLFNHWSASE